MQSIVSPSASSAQALRPTISAAPLDDGAVLLDLETKYFYAVNPSAWAILQILEIGASSEEVERRARTWGAPDDGSIAEFVRQLQRYELLQRADPTDEDCPVTWSGPWTTPSIERQAQPLQDVMVSAFDPSIPLAE